MITIIVSTHRKNSYTAKMAELVKTRLQQRGQAASVLDLRLLPRDFMWKKIEGEEHPEFDYLIGEHIRDVHKFIFVIPEYNGSFPGMVKTFIDAVPPRFFYTKKAALIGIASGRAGALRALDDMTGVLHYLQVEVLSDKPKFPGIDKILNDSGSLNDPDASVRLDKCIDKFLAF